MTDRRDDLPVLEIRISRATDTTYGVELRLGDREFPRGSLGPEIFQDDSVADRGARLFQRFTADEPVRMAWNLAAALHPQRRIRIRLDDLAPALHTLPWEALTDVSPTATARTLSADRDTPFSRHVVTSWEPPGPLVTPPIKLLSAVAAPTDLETYNLPPLDRDAEAACIAAAVAAAPPGRVVHTHLAGPCTLAALEAELEDGYHVLHLIAHGGLRRGGDGAATYFEAPDGRTDRVDATRFAAMIERLSPTLRLVVLMSCHSATRSRTDPRAGLAPQLLAAGIPAVLAMQDLVPIDTAHAFTGVFYRELWTSGEIDRASNRARATILTARLPGDAIPVLYSARASNRLWLAGADPVAQQQSAPEPAPAARPTRPAKSAAPPKAAAPAAPRPRWRPFGGPFVDVQLARQHDGSLLALAVDAAHVLHAREQSAPGGEWGEWSAAAEDTALVRVIADNRGRLCVFTLDTAGAAWCRVQDTPAGEWGEWVALGGAWIDLTPGAYADDRLTVFAVDAHHAIHRIDQQAADDDWGEWYATGGEGEAPTVYRDCDGSLEVFAVADAAIYSTCEDEDEDTGWYPWYDLEAEARRVVVTVARDGTSHMLAIGTDGAAWHTSCPAEDWEEEWHSLGGDHVDLAALEHDGRRHVFTAGTDGAAWSIVSTSRGWGDWTRLGGEHLVCVRVARALGSNLVLLALDADGQLHLYA